MPASRRSFVNGTLSALVSWPAVHSFAQNPVAPIDDEPDSPKFLDPAKLKANAQPGDIDTLFFTWFRDPCTTMVVQWIGLADEFQSADVHFGINPIKPPGRLTYRAIKKGQPASAIRTIDQLLQPIPIEYWQTIKPITKPFAPNSDLKVFRAELTGLLPDTMYRVQIGNRPATYRFRTMPTRSRTHFRLSVVAIAVSIFMRPTITLSQPPRIRVLRSSAVTSATTTASRLKLPSISIDNITPIWWPVAGDQFRS